MTLTRRQAARFAGAALVWASTGAFAQDRAPDFDAQLRASRRLHDALTLQTIQKIRQRASPELRESVRRCLQQPAAQAAHAQHVEQMRAAGRVPLGFEDFVYLQLGADPQARQDQLRGIEARNAPIDR